MGKVSVRRNPRMGVYTAARIWRTRAARTRAARTRGARARIHIRASVNNLFITLTTMGNRVIYTRSTGTCTSQTNKRRKRTNIVIEHMANEIVNKLRQVRINKIQILLRTRKRKLLRPFLSYLNTSGMRVTSILDRCKIAHNGIRAPAKPRK